MKNQYTILAAAIILAAACEKSQIQEEGPKFNPIPATIEVSIAAPETLETKMNYSFDGNILKGSWEEGDKISVISYYSVAPFGGATGEMVANDVFTAESSGKTVKFSGTFSNPTAQGAGTISIKIIYPALEGTPLASPKEPQNNYNTYGPFYIGNDKFLHLDSDRKYIQPVENSIHNLKFYTLIVGDADLANLQSGSLGTVSLMHYTYIIKASLTMPNNGYNYVIKRVGLIGQALDANPNHVPDLRFYSSADFRMMHFSGRGSQLWTYMHDIKANGDVSDTGIVFNKGQTYTVYFVGGFGSSTELYKLFSGLSQLKIQAEGTKNNQPCTLTKTLTAGGEIVMTPGNIYRLSATLVEGTNN